MGEKARLCTALAVAILLQAFVLYSQRNYGALIGLIKWDDCAVLLRGLENLDKVAQVHTLRAMLHAALLLNIHAPVSDIQAILGLLLTGGAIWGPYALNVTCLCVAIYALSTTLPPKDSIIFGVSILFLLVQPITFGALSEVQSDWDGGILLAAALLVLFEAAEQCDNQTRAVGAALLGLMLLTKTTAFYLPPLALGVFLIFEFYSALRAAVATKQSQHLSLAVWNAVINSFGTRVRQRAMCAALIIVPYVLFFYQARKTLLPYIRGALGSKWADGFTIYKRALFYSPFENGGAYDGAAWGGLHFMFLTFFVAALVASIAKRAWLHVFACSGVILIAVMFLMPLVVAHTSSISFGAPFFGAVMGGTLILSRIFLLNIPRWAALSAPIVVLALALPSAMFVKSYGLNARLELEHYQSIFDEIAGTIAQRTTAVEPEVVFTFSHDFMPYPNLGIRYFQRTGHFLSLARIDDLNHLDAADEAFRRNVQKPAPLFARADFVVTITPNAKAGNVPFLARWAPISADPSLADARVRESGRYGAIANYQVPGAKVWLYQAATPQ